MICSSPLGIARTSKKDIRCVPIEDNFDALTEQASKGGTFASVAT